MSRFRPGEAICDDCGYTVPLTPTGLLTEHQAEKGGPRCPGSGLRPLNPGGGELHGFSGGLPTLGKDR